MIVLINPPISSIERYGRDIDGIGGHQMPLGIYSLAARLEAEGEPVELIDAEAFGLSGDEVAQRVVKVEPLLVGITSTTVAFRNARQLAELIRSRVPRPTPIVLGGPHFTALPLESLKFEAFDFGIAHEGEEALVALVRALRLHSSFEGLPNLYWRDPSGTVRTPERFIEVEDLDRLPPPARHLCPDLGVYRPPVGAFRQQPVVSMVTSRGCPYECIFCDNNTFGRKVRFHSAERVASEIEKLIRDDGAREIAFLDDTFVLNKTRLRRIFEILDQKRVSFSWSCMTRANNLDRETIAFMAEHGCWQVRLGIESGNQAILNQIKKGITLEQVRAAAKGCHAEGISVSGFFMLGHPTESRQSIEETIDFACSLPLTDVICTIHTPMPGTESYRIARRHGQYDESDWSSLNYWSPVFVPHGLTREHLLQKQREFYRRFFLRPSVLWRQVRKIRSPRLLFFFLRNAFFGLAFVIRRRASGPS